MKHLENEEKLDGPIYPKGTQFCKTTRTELKGNQISAHKALITKTKKTRISRKSFPYENTQQL